MRELEDLEQAVDALRDGADVPQNLERMNRVHAFLCTAVREHNEKEECALFPFLSEDAPTELFIAEHETLRSLEQRLHEALQSADAAEAAIEPAGEIVHLLREHIRREDEALFPMARAELGPDGLERVRQKLEMWHRQAPAGGDPGRR